VAVGLGEVDRMTIGRIGTDRAYPGGTGTGWWGAVRDFAALSPTPGRIAGFRGGGTGASKCTTLSGDLR
ncbi:MAG TPA: hypothetical protein VJX66_25045, partial [Amycolatopsis sp.]|nr:hypothetical protein [Amycolatopsis sp.]